MNDIEYMDIALDIAYKRMGGTSPNPAVGAVIVKDDKIIATGGTGAYGQAHAEATAIKTAFDNGADLQGASIYVSLEPCNHHGKTPPCTEAIIQSGIKKVFIPMLDPNPIVAGGGAAALEAGGVQVIFLSERSGPAEDLIRPFKKYILQKKPFILSKSAMTLDGKTAMPSGDSKWITSPYSRYLTHRLRAKVDAIIVGKNTIEMDNPSLDVRFNDFSTEVKDFFSKERRFTFGRENGFLNRLMEAEEPAARDPLRVAMGLPERINETANFFKDNNYLVIETEDNYNKIMNSNKQKWNFIVKENVMLIRPGTLAQQIDSAMEALYNSGIMFALLEGGSKVAGSFFDSGNIDQFLYFMAPIIVGAGSPVLDGRGKVSMSDALRLCDVSRVMLGEDLLLCGYSEPYSLNVM